MTVPAQLRVTVLRTRRGTEWPFSAGATRGSESYPRAWRARRVPLETSTRGQAMSVTTHCV